MIKAVIWTTESGALKSKIFTDGKGYHRLLSRMFKGVCVQWEHDYPVGRNAVETVMEAKREMSSMFDRLDNVGR